MNWNDYEAIWKRQDFPVGAAADLASLKDTFEAKRRKTAAALFARDWLEAGAGLLASAGLGFAWWQMGRTGWPFAASIALILGVTAIFVGERLRARRNRLGPGAPMLIKVEAEITELRHQRQLIRYIGGWYYAPSLVAIAIGFETLSRRLGHTNAPPGLLQDLLTNPLTLVWIIILASTITVAFGLAWRANREAVRKHIDPRLAELEKLRQDLFEQP